MRALTAVDLDPAAPEGVEAAPPAGDVEELQPADRRGESGVDDEMLALWLEPEHRPQEEQRGSGRPRLRAAGGRVLDRILRSRALVAAERLGQAPVEELGRIEDPRRNLGSLLLESVTAGAPSAERGFQRAEGARVGP